jgi:hypothetical protein
MFVASFPPEMKENGLIRYELRRSFGSGKKSGF